MGTRGMGGGAWYCGCLCSPISSLASLPLSISPAIRGICGVISPACNAGSSYRFQKNSMVWNKNRMVDARDAYVNCRIHHGHTGEIPVDG